MKYWVFDLDGTLVDSFSHYFNILEDIASNKFTCDEKRRFISMDPHQILSEKIAADKIQDGLKELSKRSQSDARVIAVFDSMKKAIETISDKGRQIAIWTSRDLASTRLIVESTGLNKFVDHIISGDCVTVKKPHPEGLEKIKNFFNCHTDEMVMIGDHDVDMKAGQKLGVQTIRASWHKHWDHEVCSIANKQFYCDKLFAEWVSKTLNK